MAGYTKLHNCILDSSIWGEDVYTRVVWIFMLAKVDANGRVIVAPSLMAKQANVPQSKLDRALVKLSSPDPQSKTPDHEGRRIVQIQGGWLILNYQRYRKMLNAEERREYQRQWDREHRPSGQARKRSPTQSDTIPTSPTQAEAEAEAYNPPIVPPKVDGFDSFWKLYPRKVGKGGARKVWAKLKPGEKLVQQILETVAEQKESVQWTKDGGQYIPHPATWLNQERWGDELEPLYHDPTEEEIQAFNARYRAKTRKGEDIVGDD